MGQAGGLGYERRKVGAHSGQTHLSLDLARLGHVHFVHDRDDERPDRRFRVFEDLARGVALVFHEDGLAHAGPDRVEREDVAGAVEGSVRQDGPHEELFPAGIEGVLDGADDRSEDAPEDHRITASPLPLFSRLEMMLVHDAHHGVVHRDEPRIVQERGLAGRFPRHEVARGGLRRGIGGDERVGIAARSWASGWCQHSDAEEIPFRGEADGIRSNRGDGDRVAVGCEELDFIAGRRLSGSRIAFDDGPDVSRPQAFLRQVPEKDNFFEE